MSNQIQSQAAKRSSGQMIQNSIKVEAEQTISQSDLLKEIKSFFEEYLTYPDLLILQYEIKDYKILNHHLIGYLTNASQRTKFKRINSLTGESDHFTTLAFHTNEIAFGNMEIPLSSLKKGQNIFKPLIYQGNTHLSTELNGTAVNPSPPAPPNS